MDEQKAFAGWGLSANGWPLMHMMSFVHQLPNLLCLFCLIDSASRVDALTTARKETCYE